MKAVRQTDDGVTLKFDTSTRLEITGGALSDAVYKSAREGGWLTEEGYAPTFAFMDDAEFDALQQRAVLCARMDALMDAGDCKAAVMLCAPLKVVKDEPVLWDSADGHRLGRACSKLATTLLIKAGETKKLDRCRQYREMCEMFLRRGAELEPDNPRCATALAYRYYSNVHELMRPGERRDQDLEQQIELANEWLSRSLEIYPQSVRNHYRKGKLIIEKQAPYLLFGKRAYGSREAELLREIREVGEEHLATAIALYEALEDEEAKSRDRREYAKALYVLGGYYLDDAYLPIHEYFLRRIAGREDMPSIALISSWTSERHRALEKGVLRGNGHAAFPAGHGQLAQLNKQWTRSPVEKLYKLGCAESAAAFIALARGRLRRWRGTPVGCPLPSGRQGGGGPKQDRRRNTWHISEKLAWAHIYTGQYDRAARLISRAKAGYIVNTYAITLLLMNTSASLRRAEEVLSAAVRDGHNLASGLSSVLWAYVRARRCQDIPPLGKTLSARNRRLAALLGVAGKAL